MEGVNDYYDQNRGSTETEEAYYRELLVCLLEEPPQVDHLHHHHYDQVYDSQRLLCLIQSLEAEINSAATTTTQSPMDFAIGQALDASYVGESQSLCPLLDFSNSISWNDDHQMMMSFGSGPILGYGIDHDDWNVVAQTSSYLGFEHWGQQ